MIKIIKPAEHFKPANVEFRYAEERYSTDEFIIKALVKQDRPVEMPVGDVIITPQGRYQVGIIPGTLIDHEELQKDWCVIHSYAGGPTYLDIHPLMGVAIVVMMLGMRSPRQGILASHDRSALGYDMIGKDTDMVFLELMPSKEEAAKVTGCPIEVVTRFGSEQPTIAYYVPHAFSSVIAWQSIETNGRLSKPIRPEPIKWYIDCEFEDSTKTLLSMGIANAAGNVHYALVADAGKLVKEQWVIDNVIPHLTSVPGTGPIHRIGRPSDSTFRTFSDFIAYVWSLESTGETTELEIHVDFSTDVEYVSSLFHLGKGERIRPMTKLSFVVDYVDSYPTELKGAVQHNAGWDALALYEKVGAGKAYVDRSVQTRPFNPHHDNPHWPDGVRDTLAKRAESLAKRLAVYDDSLIDTAFGGSGHSRTQMFKNSKVYVMGENGAEHVDLSTFAVPENLVPSAVEFERTAPPPKSEDKPTDK